MKLYQRMLCVFLTLVLLTSTIGSVFDGITLETSAESVASYSTGLSLAQLQTKFPHGKYWNHKGEGHANNNPDGWTDTPCTCHGQGICVSGSESCTCNGYTSDGTATGPRKASQCMGFAYKLQQDAYGGNPYSWEENDNYTSAMANLKPGDVVRYGGHSIFITYVNGNYIEYADCNSSAGGRCQIRWGAHDQTKSSLESTFSYVTHAPSVLKGATAPNTLPTTSCTCNTSYTGTYTCTTSSLPLTIRAGHSSSSSAIGSIPSGATVSVTKADGKWAHVTYNGISGYASMSYLKLKSSSSSSTSSLTKDSRYPTPIKMYALSTNEHAANAYLTYNDLLGAPATDKYFVYNEDYITINAVYTNTIVYLSCPWDGNTAKNVYSYGPQFFIDMSVTPKKQTAERKIYTYIRAGSSSQLGWVDIGDTIYVLGAKNGYTQIIYPHSDEYYRCGWCKTTDLAHTHTLGAAATCTTAQVCTVCDAIIKNPIGHTYNQKNTNSTYLKSVATCTASAVYYYSCTCGECGSSTFTSGTVISHSWNSGVITTQPTCTKTGVKTYTCSSCKGTKTATVAATGNHTAGSWTITKSATCTDTGTKVQKCTVCGVTLKIESIAALGHNWNSGVITTQPTATVEGVKTYTCTVCSATKTELIPSKGFPDINLDGKIDKTDAENILKYITGHFVEIDKKSSDINGDGEINIRDVAMFLFYINNKND